MGNETIYPPYIEDYIGEKANQLRRDAIAYNVLPNLNKIAVEYYRKGLLGSHSLPLVGLGVQVGPDNIFSIEPPPSFINDLWSFSIHENVIEGIGKTVRIENRVKKDSSSLVKIRKDISTDNEGRPLFHYEKKIDSESFKWIFENPEKYSKNKLVLRGILNFNDFIVTHRSNQTELDGVEAKFEEFKKIFDSPHTSLKQKDQMKVQLLGLEAFLLLGDKNTPNVTKNALRYLAGDLQSRHEAKHELLDYIGELEVSLSELKESSHRGKVPIMRLEDYHDYSSLSPAMFKISAQDGIKSRIDEKCKKINKLALDCKKLADDSRANGNKYSEDEAKKYGLIARYFRMNVNTVLGLETQLCKGMFGKEKEEAKERIAEQKNALNREFMAIKTCLESRDMHLIRVQIADSSAIIAGLVSGGKYLNGRQKKIHVNDELNMFFSKRNKNHHENRQLKMLDSNEWASLPVPKWPVPEAFTGPLVNWTREKGGDKNLFRWLSNYLSIVGKYDGTLSYVAESENRGIAPNSKIYSSARWLYADLAARSLAEMNLKSSGLDGLIKKIRYLANQYEDEAGRLPKVMGSMDNVEKGAYLYQMMTLRQNILSSVQETLVFLNGIKTDSKKDGKKTLSISDAKKLLIFYLMEVGGWVDAKNERKFLSILAQTMGEYEKENEKLPNSQNLNDIRKNIDNYINSLEQWNSKTALMYEKLKVEEEKDSSNLKSVQEHLKKNLPIHAKALDYSMAHDRFHNSYKSGEPYLYAEKDVFTPELLGLSCISLIHEVQTDSLFLRALKSKNFNREFNDYARKMGEQNPFYHIQSYDELQKIEGNVQNFLDILLDSNTNVLNDLCALRGNGNELKGKEKVLNEIIPSCPSYHHPELDPRDLVVRLIHGSTIRQEPIGRTLTLNRRDSPDGDVAGSTSALFEDTLNSKFSVAVPLYFIPLKEGIYTSKIGDTLASEAYGPAFSKKDYARLVGGEQPENYYDFKKAFDLTKDFTFTLQDYMHKLIIGDEGNKKSGNLNKFENPHNAQEIIDYTGCSLAYSVNVFPNKMLTFIHVDTKGNEKSYEIVPNGITPKKISPIGKLVTNAQHHKISDELKAMSETHIIFKRQMKICEKLNGAFAFDAVHDLVLKQKLLAKK